MFMSRCWIFCLLFLASGCIENDVPYPVIYGNVEKFEVPGQQKCVINTKERTVSLVLADTVDIEHLPLNVFEITEGAACDWKPGMFLDLSELQKLVISTYQQYEWTVKAEQPIDRYVKLKDYQVGDAVFAFDSLKETRTVKIYVTKGTKLAEVRIKSLKLGPSIAKYTPDPRTLTDFTRGQKIEMSCFGRTEEWQLFVFEKEENDGHAGEVKVEPWGLFARLSVIRPSGAEGNVVFEYREADETDWLQLEPETVSGEVYSVKVPGLSSTANYVARVKIGEQVMKEVAFTTEAIEQIPYMSFDSWYMDGKASCPGVEGIVTWDTGNKGGASFGFNPTTEEKSDVVKGSAARLASVYAAVKFAAGSIYTGSFGGLDGLNAMLDFGIPYACRPTRLSGYYKYNPGVIDKVKAPYEYLNGRSDTCHIYIALCAWNEPFRANSKTQTFVDYSTNNSSIIAYGELKSARKMDKYEKFSIDLSYRDTTRKPTYIVVVASSSKYGDYFSGSTSSVLLIDEFELGFD